MKNLCLTLVLALVAGLAHAQWARTALGLAPGYTPYYLDAPAPGVVWVVNQNDQAPGADQVAVTTTGGQAWSTRTVAGLRASEFITGLSALDATTAWVAVQSEDFDPVTGSVVADGRVLRTTNGGLTWQAQTAAGQLTDTYPSSIQFFSATLGVLLGRSATGYTCLRTTNAGLTWAAVPMPAPVGSEALLKTLPARVGNHLWAGTDQGRVLHSPDAGLTWQVRPAVANGLSAYQVAFQTPLNGLLASEDAQFSYLSATTDGGRTWSMPRRQRWATGPVGLAPVPNTAQTVLLGQPGSAFTSDGGLTQTVLETLLMHIDGRMVSATEGYAAAEVGGAGPGVYRFTSQALPSRAAGTIAAPTAHPNPSPDGRFCLPAPASGAPGTTWRVLDALGREVLAPQPLPAAPAAALLDLSTHRPGLYTLEVRSAAGVARQQLLRP